MIIAGQFLFALAMYGEGRGEVIMKRRESR